MYKVVSSPRKVVQMFMLVIYLHIQNLPFFWRTLNRNKPVTLKTSTFLNCYLEWNNYPCYSVITLKKSSTRNLAAIICHNSHQAKYNPKRSCIMKTNLLIGDQTKTLYSWGVKLMIPKLSSRSAGSLFVLFHVSWALRDPNQGLIQIWNNACIIQ